MKIRLLILALSVPLTVACGGDDAEACETKVDFTRFVDNATQITATVDGNIATIDCEFDCPVPDQVSDKDFLDSFASTSALSILNEDSGVTVTLADDNAAGAPLADGADPTEPGQWSLSLTRNDSPVLNSGVVHIKVNTALMSGQELRVGGNYMAAFMSADNAFAEDVAQTSLPLVVE